MGKTIAVTNQAITTPGTTPYQPATSGTWITQPVQYKTHARARIKGRPVIVEASCTFSFTGLDTSKNPPVSVSGTEKVVLQPGTTRLQKSVLVHGDMARGQHGNKLEIKASGPATTG